MTFRLFLLRHGQSEGNATDLFTGRIDSELTPEGRREARHAARQLAGSVVNFDVAFASRQRRAQETCAIILATLGLSTPTEFHEALNERDYGELTGLSKADAVQEWGATHVETWRRSFDIAPPGGESLSDTLERVKVWYTESVLSRAFDGANMLVVAHGNSLRALVMLLESTPAEQSPSIEIARCAPLIYRVDPLTGRRENSPAPVP